MDIHSNSVSDISASSQFDYLTSPLVFTSDEIDCFTLKTKNITSTYTLFLNNSATYDIQNKILNYVNSISNYENSIIIADNYFDISDNNKKAKYNVVFEDDVLKSIECKTKITYAPTSGNYTDYNITLDNILTLEFNKKYSDALKYEKPSKAINIGGLKYIL